MKFNRDERIVDDASLVKLGEEMGLDSNNIEELAELKSADLTDDISINSLIIRLQFLYSFAGLILSGVCIFGGLLLYYRGISGSASWTAMLLGIESGLSDAAPGAILFIVGFFIVSATRFVIKNQKNNKSSD